MTPIRLTIQVVLTAIVYLLVHQFPGSIDLTVPAALMVFSVLGYLQGRSDGRAMTSQEVQ
jgi:hypothetical protein